MSSGFVTISALTDLGSTNPSYQTSSYCGSTYSGTGVGTGVGVGDGEGVGEGDGVGVDSGAVEDVSSVTAEASSEGDGLSTEHPLIGHNKAATVTVTASFFNLSYRSLIGIFPARAVIILDSSDIYALSVTLECVYGHLLIKP